MKKFNFYEMENITGGSVLTASIAGGTCVASLVWPIGTLIFGPTCIGMVIKTVVD